MFMQHSLGYTEYTYVHMSLLGLKNCVNTLKDAVVRYYITMFSSLTVDILGS